MARKSNVLPPLDYLLAFEVAADCQSFAAASRKLNISESAISRKVRLLELHYGVPLFMRGHKSVTLTAHGSKLVASVSPAIQSLREISREVLSRQNRSTVTLAATNSVAMLWLMPRLRKFTNKNKQLKIMLVASDYDDECLASNVDLSILRGDGAWSGYRTSLMFGETVFPVCSPGYLAANPAIRDLNQLAKHALIEVSSTHTEWMNWPDWLHAAGVVREKPGQSTAFNTYPLAVQAAVDGLGIALGWGHLVDHLIVAGALVRPTGNTQVRSESGYYLLCPTKKKSFPERDVVENWLLTESACRKRHGS
jgi:LysR family transcriptional regulator, glycine cleavage system transcriptional activator